MEKAIITTEDLKELAFHIQNSPPKHIQHYDYYGLLDKFEMKPIEVHERTINKMYLSAKNRI